MRTLLFLNSTGQTCDHEQFAKGLGCITHINIELGGRMWVALDRSSETYKITYKQRTASERINSQAKSLEIEHLKVRDVGSVRNLNYSHLHCHQCPCFAPRPSAQRPCSCLIIMFKVVPHY